jgi:hypothetical protein
LRIVGPTGELTSGSEFGAAAVLDTAVDGVQGWSFGVAHDAAVLDLLSAAPGSTTQTVNNGRLPDFLNITTNPAEGTGVTIAAVISFVLPITLAAGDGYELLSMQYRVVADPSQVDPCEPVVSEVAYSNMLRNMPTTPPVGIVLTVNGDSQTPRIQNLPVTVRCPGTIEFTRCDGDPDNVFLEWTFGGAPDWDFLFLYRNSEFLVELPPDATSYDDLGLAPGIYDYTLVTFIVDDPANPQLVFAHCQATVIPLSVTDIQPRIGYFLGGDEVTITGTAFTSVETSSLDFFAAGEDPLPLEVLAVVSPTEMRGRTPRSPRLGRYHLRLTNERGSAELLDAFDYGFIRGEANADGNIDISDGIAILNSLFLGEMGIIICLDAADTTDDGIIDISDGIRIFLFLFLGGRPPRPPHPEPGFDPTTRDDLGCLDMQA